MKNFNIVLVAVFTLISTGALAQNNNNRSKKEQMKMEVVKNENHSSQNHQ